VEVLAWTGVKEKCKWTFLGKEKGLINTFWVYVDLPQSTLQVPLSMTALTAVRNRDDKVYSVTASC
jgi:hypothetical protein